MAITLVTFPRAFGLPNPSPFGVKTLVLLKMAALPFTIEETPNPRKGPKGKLPAIRDEGALIGDSEIIRWHIERKHGIDLDRGLTAAERAVAHAFARMLEERTYWAIVYCRFIEEGNWPLLRKELFGGMPPLLRTIAANLVRRTERRALHAQGLGRHSRTEIYAMGCADLRAAATHLADKPFFMGAEPSSLDATAYAMVSAIADAPFPSPMKEEALRNANLTAYCARMKSRYFGASGSEAS
jgi:glutathione S-transferase